MPDSSGICMLLILDPQDVRVAPVHLLDSRSLPVLRLLRPDVLRRRSKDGADQ